MNLFFDRCLGKRLPKAIRELKPPVEITSYYDTFPHESAGYNDVPDDVWLQLVGSNGWFVITQDDKWHRERVHLDAIRQHRVGCFVLSGAQDPSWTTARLILSKLEEIMTVCLNTPRPFLYHIDKAGKIKPRLQLQPLADESDVAG